MHIILFAAICELGAGIILQNIGQKKVISACEHKNAESISKGFRIVSIGKGLTFTAFIFFLFVLFVNLVSLESFF